MKPKPLRNVFACLVHENPDCIVDMVRNLHFLDPDSAIVLYNGGHNPDLLKDLPVEPYGVVVHPSPQPMKWGTLHGFALDTMRFALEHIPFDTFTNIDSDQLALRPGYAAYLAQYLDGQQGVGMLGNAPERQGPGTKVPPAKTAHKEMDLWRPFLRRFPGGEAHYVHWTFWPSTVFTADAARALVHLFDTDTQLQEIMAKTRMWATEEVILPTLVKVLGFRILANPCCYDYVEYRVKYSNQQLKKALIQPDAYWMHPVPRQMKHPLRAGIRAAFGQYEASPRLTPGPAGLLLTRPILQQMNQIEGWLSEDEADLLMAVTARALSALPDAGALVEIGSYCGRATVVIGRVAEALDAEATIYAIDPHDGKLGAADRGFQIVPPSRSKFERTLKQTGLQDRVEIIQKRASEVAWDRPVSLLLVDGLHDYANVARDFYHFADWIVPGGYVAFHDYASYFPGVRQLVDEVLSRDDFRKVHCAGTLMVLQKSPAPEAPRAKTTTKNQQPQAGPCAPVAGSSRSRIAAEPLVSCIMPTANRRAFVLQALTYFMRQDYPHRELIVVDDGPEPVEDLMPDDPRVRYLRLDRRHSIGAKRNLACQAAQGELIAHWDDDDWVADWRLRYQVEHLMREKADLCGLDSPLFYDPYTEQSWQYVYPSGNKKWVYGATFCYTKALWRRHPFLDVNLGEDTCFVWSACAAKVLALEDVNFFVGLIHPGNTSQKRTSGHRWHTFPNQKIQHILDADWDFYERFKVE